MGGCRRPVTGHGQACRHLGERGATPPLPRVHPQARRQLGHVRPGAIAAAAVLPPLLPPLPPRPRAHEGEGGADRRRQPPQLPRPVRDRRLPALAEADELRRQDGAVRKALAGLAALPGRRLPDSPRRVRRGGDEDGADGPRSRRDDLHLPRGDADSQRLAVDTEARSRPAGAADRRPGGPDRGARDRAGPPRLADPAAQGAAPARTGDDLSPRRAALAGARRDRDGADLAQRRAAVGGPRRAAGDAPRCGDRRR